jgi:hypothetical protein
MTDMEGRAMDKQILVELMFGFGVSAAGADRDPRHDAGPLDPPAKPTAPHQKTCQKSAARKSSVTAHFNGLAEGTAARQRDMTDPNVAGGRAIQQFFKLRDACLLQAPSQEQAAELLNVSRPAEL